jgi:hypothetical protein
LSGQVLLLLLLLLLLLPWLGQLSLGCAAGGCNPGLSEVLLSVC